MITSAYWNLSRIMIGSSILSSRHVSIAISVCVFSSNGASVLFVSSAKNVKYERNYQIIKFYWVLTHFYTIATFVDLCRLENDLNDSHSTIICSPKLTSTNENSVITKFNWLSFWDSKLFIVKCNQGYKIFVNAFTIKFAIE